MRPQATLSTERLAPASRPARQKMCLVFVVCGMCLCVFAEASAQKRQAVVILRAPGASVAPCDGATELNYQLAGDLKFNNKDEVRMGANIGTANDSTLISRKAYEESRKTKMKDLFALRWGADGVNVRSKARRPCP